MEIKITQTLSGDILVKGVTKETIPQCLYILDMARDVIKTKRKRAILQDGTWVGIED